MTKGSIVGFDLSEQCQHRPILVHFNRTLTTDEVDSIQSALQAAIQDGEYKLVQYNDEQLISKTINELATMFDYDYELLPIDYMVYA